MPLFTQKEGIDCQLASFNNAENVMLWVFWMGHYRVAVYHWVAVTAGKRKGVRDTAAHRGPPQGLVPAPAAYMIEKLHIPSTSEALEKRPSSDCFNHQHRQL